MSLDKTVNGAVHRGRAPSPCLDMIAAVRRRRHRNCTLALNRTVAAKDFWPEFGQLKAIALTAFDLDEFSCSEMGRIPPGHTPGGGSAAPLSSTRASPRGHGYSVVIPVAMRYKRRAARASRI